MSDSSHYRVLVINSEERVVKVVSIKKSSSLKELQDLVGGLIQTALYLENGDLVFVDEEGLFKSPQVFFYLDGAPHPFAGNGVVVSQEEYEDANSSEQYLLSRVKFLSLAEVRRGQY